MKMMDDMRRGVWHQLLEPESKTTALEDEFMGESLPRCNWKYINCGNVFICLKCISFYLYSLSQKKEGWQGGEKGYSGEFRGKKEKEGHTQVPLQIAPKPGQEGWR